MNLTDKEYMEKLENLNMIEPEQFGVVQSIIDTVRKSCETGVIKHINHWLVFQDLDSVRRRRVTDMLSNAILTAPIQEIEK